MDAPSTPSKDSFPIALPSTSSVQFSREQVRPGTYLGKWPKCFEISSFLYKGSQMSTAKGLLTAGICILHFGLAPAALPQTRSISGGVRTASDIAVKHTEVSVDEGGTDVTTDSGKFSFPLSPRLRVGFPATFHVAGWVITDPCVHGRGRTYVPDPDAESVAITVLPRGDQQLLAQNSIDCLMKEKFSRIEPKSGSAGKPHASLRSSPPVFAERGQPVITGWRTSQHQGSGYATTLVAASYPASLVLALSWRTAQKNSENNPSVTDEFLTKQAKELGFTTAELTEAIGRWAKSVKDPYETGLAALYEGRYADASQYITESIKSSTSDVLERTC